jgi:hypothetical protein
MPMPMGWIRAVLGPRGGGSAPSRTPQECPDDPAAAHDAGSFPSGQPWSGSTSEQVILTADRAEEITR